MSTEIIASVALTILLYVAYTILNYRRRLSFIKAVDVFPGPRSFPVIGNIPSFRKNFVHDILYIADELVDTYPSPYRFWIGNNAIIGIYDVDQIKTVLRSQCFDKSVFYDTLKPMFGLGILTSSTSLWMIHRKIAGPVFNTNNLRVHFFNKFVKSSLILTDKLEKLSGNKIVLFDAIIKCTYSIAFETLMGVKMKSQTMTEFIEVTKSFKDNWSNYVLLSTFWNLNVTLNFTKIGNNLRKLSSVCNCVTNEIIEKNKCTLDKLDISESNNKGKKTFYTYFLEANQGQKLTQKEFYDNILTIVLTASDTIAIVINFVIIVLANFPEIQEKVYKELSEIYSMHSPKSVSVKYEDLQRMDYLNRVIKETMRVFPAIPLIGRLVTKDLKIGEFTVPKGVNIIIFILNLHRNKKYWPNPLSFDPDRFLPERNINSSNYYIPFSDGLRNCIGMNYATMSMKVILATLIRTFEFQTDKKVKIDEIKLKMNITLEPVNPIKIKIKKRNFQ